MKVFLIKKKKESHTSSEFIFFRIVNNMFIFPFLDICLTTLDMISTKKEKHMPAHAVFFLTLDRNSVFFVCFLETFSVFKLSSHCFKCGKKWLSFSCIGIFSYFCVFPLCVPLLMDTTYPIMSILTYFLAILKSLTSGYTMSLSVIHLCQQSTRLFYMVMP